MEGARRHRRSLGGLEQATLPRKRGKGFRGLLGKAHQANPDVRTLGFGGKNLAVERTGRQNGSDQRLGYMVRPVSAELPHLEKFYEKFKDRTDIQVPTFDIDEDLGLVAPYLNEKGYSSVACVLNRGKPA